MISPDDSLLLGADGQPLTVYHGTRAGVIECFRPHIRRGEQIGFGIHFAFEKRFALAYAEDPSVSRSGRLPTLHQANLAAQRPLIADRIVHEEDESFELAEALAQRKVPAVRDELGRRSFYLQNAIDGSGPERAQRMIQSAGYDAVIYLARLRTPPLSHGAYQTLQASRAITVFSSAQVRNLSAIVLEPNKPRKAPRRPAEAEGPTP